MILIGNLTTSCLSPPDGELYTGTVSNFQGNEPVIYKSLGQGAALKTENSLKWLQGKVIRVADFFSFLFCFLFLFPPHDTVPILFSAQQISLEK